MSAVAVVRADGTEGRLGVEADVDPLRLALLHRPGEELRAVSARAAGRSLFDAAVDPVAAGREHDVLTGVLRAAGAEVMYVEEAVASVLADPLLAEGFLRRAVPGASAATRGALREMPPWRAACALVVGMGDVLDPLPNLMFQRDPSVWLGPRAGVARMASPVRGREADLIEALYRTHPRFAAMRPETRPGRVEGGDVLVVGGGRVAIAVSERTASHDARRLGWSLLSAGIAREIVLLSLPRAIAFHLDLALTLVDRDTVIVWDRARAALRGELWTARGVSPLADPVAALVPGGRVIEVPGERHGREWDHGTNVLALAPGRVVAYEDNERANARLAAAGVDVLTVPGRALGAGRGGPHCLVCPVWRGYAAAGANP